MVLYCLYFSSQVILKLIQSARTVHGAYLNQHASNYLQPLTDYNKVV